jgi:hypothetical protein
MFLWAVARNMEVYVQNRTPHGILGDKSLKEALSGVKPEIVHLRIFAFPILIHVPMEKRMNL